MIDWILMAIGMTTALSCAGAYAADLIQQQGKSKDAKGIE